MSSDFRNPPVSEVVIAVQFEPLAGVTSGHLGYFASLLGQEWQIHAEVNRLPEVHERFGPAPALRLPGIGVRLQHQTASNRLQVIQKTEDRMVQLQDTHFVYNWIKKDKAYPRFEIVRDEFNSKFGLFRAFLLSNQLGQLRLNQWEVTYVNHIPRGSLWQSPSEWGAVLPEMICPIREFGGTVFENMNAEWRAEISPKRGRLHITMRQKIEAEQPILVLQLTARGPIAEDDLQQGLELGHKTIVKSFVDITSQPAHELWERI